MTSEQSPGDQGESARPAEESAPVRSALRADGMRDLGPDAMERFRRVERRFLAVTAARGYREIRTPSIEPLHLFTSTGALAPQLLDRVYSFLDWDGWSGERVVLRPDTTVPAARWYVERGAAAAGDTSGVARLSYVQPVYRFAAVGDREQWQCGVELFGLPSLQADAELLLLARECIEALGLGAVTFELAHAGLLRAALSAAGLDAAQQIDTYDRLLAGGDEAVERLLAEHEQGTSALRLLFGVGGVSAAYLANLRAALVPAVPEAGPAVEELEAAARALDAAGCAYEVRAVGARSFEYYTGVTFVARSAGTECITGGRYDGLDASLGGPGVPACGFGADLMRLADLAAAEPQR